MRAVRDLDRVETWREGIKVTDLKRGDIIYIRKVVNDFHYHYKCRFIKFEKSMVIAKILEYEPEWIAKPASNIMRARAKCCYLWGKTEKMLLGYCHWCENGVFK